MFIPTDSIDKLLHSQIKIIKPKNLFTNEVSSMIDKITLLLKKANIDASCMAGGSYAKGTFIGKTFDVDLFIRFNYAKYVDSNISTLLTKAISSLKPELVHGSRDYFHIQKGIILFEIIPVLKIDNYKFAKNVTDMSPLHVGYAVSEFDKKINLRDDIRLTKQFMKSIGVYGAESHIKGFSGHVVDLLLIYYGSFTNLLMQASVWSDCVVIDVKNNLDNPLAQLNNSKTQCPLIMVDPVQLDRNASAAVGEEAFEKFKIKAREFLQNPSKEFFTIRKLDLKKIKKEHSKNLFISLRVVPLIGKDDVSGSKVLKVFEFLQTSLLENDFDIVDCGWEYGKICNLYFVVKKEKLSSEIIVMGPFINDKKNVDFFKKKHKKTFEDEGRIFAKETRLFVDPHKLLKVFVNKHFVKERVKRITFS